MSKSSLDPSNAVEFPERRSQFEQSPMFPNSTDLATISEATTESKLYQMSNVDGRQSYHLSELSITTNVSSLEWTFRPTVFSTDCIEFKLSGSVHIPDFKSTFWWLKANATVIFRNNNNHGRYIEKKIRDIIFKNDNVAFGIAMTVDNFGEIFDPNCVKTEENYVGDRLPCCDMTTELRIEVVNSHGLRSFRNVSYDFSKATDQSDCMLLLKTEKTIFVNLGFLCEHSEYFACLFRRKSELPKDPSNGFPIEKMLDVDYEEFNTLLMVVYPSKMPFNEANVSFLLALADRFLFEGVLSDLEKYLASPNSEEIDVPTKLQWSLQYQMARLESFALSQLNTRESMARLKNSPIYSNLPPEVTKCLFEKLLRL